MLYRGFEIVTTLNRDNEWYAVVIYGDQMDQMPLTDSYHSRLDAYREGRAMADRIAAQIEREVRGSTNAA